VHLAILFLDTHGDRAQHSGSYGPFIGLCAARDGISQYLVTLAKNEKHPSEFLLEHLQGTRSLFEKDDANTNAVYRSVAVKALTQWLVSDEAKAKQEQSMLTDQLMQMHQNDRRVYLRIAASDVLDAVADIRDGVAG
jgi:hypothetical protein